SASRARRCGPLWTIIFPGGGASTVPDGFALAALNEAMRFRIDQFMRRFESAQVGSFEVVSRAPELLSASNPAEVTITVFPWRLEPNANWQSSRDPAYNA